MTSESTRPQDSTEQLIRDLATEACVALFDAYGVAVKPVPSSQDTDNVSMTGIVGFTGPGMWGMCLLGGSEEPLKASNPTEGSLRDWIAELSNQLAGRLKRQLVSHGVVVYITTPIVIRGVRIEPLPRSEQMQRPITFEAGGGHVYLWVEVETSPDFVLTAGSSEDTVAEGEAILF